MPQNLTDDKSTLVQVMAWCQDLQRHMVSLGPNELSNYGTDNISYLHPQPMNPTFPYLIHCEQIKWKDPADWAP